MLHVKSLIKQAVELLDVELKKVRHQKVDPSDSFETIETGGDAYEQN